MNSVKVYVDLPEFIGPGVRPSQAMFRVVKALKEHSGPNVVLVRDANVADVVVLHVIGYPETVERVEAIKAAGKRYAIMQYCMRTTQESSTLKWLQMWRDAVCVWSYYDLEAMWKEDMGSTALQIEPQEFGVNFYHAPLGVDLNVFKPWPSVPRIPGIITSGYVAEVEGVRECEEATKLAGLKMFHLGPDLGFSPHVRRRHGINDNVLAQIYAQYWFVAGLRRCEGFELPAAEGACCGCTPVVFDTPTYRRWYEGLAQFVPEGDHELVTSCLYQLFTANLPALTTEQIELARQRFDWANLVPYFWAKVLENWVANKQPVVTKVEKQVEQTVSVEVKSKPVLLWCGDAVVSSGFAKGTHKTLEVLQKYYEVHVLGINYFGDPHQYPYKIWSCRTLKPQFDIFGINRVPELVRKLRPSVMVVQNDPWNFRGYLQAAGNCPVVGIVAIDGKNCAHARELNGLRYAIFWTEFARKEAHRGGYQGLSTVIGLGVDLNVFSPPEFSKRELRERSGWPTETLDAFVLGNVNRNQPRKRLDLVCLRFCEWVKKYNVNDAYLFLHVAPTGDVGINVSQLMEDQGLANRLILSEPEPGFGAPERALRNLYGSFDVLFSMTQGEGWGLPHMEAMACGVPTIAPDWAALGEWARMGSILVPVTDYAVTIGGPNAIGGIADRKLTIDILDQTYRHRHNVIPQLSAAALDLVREPQFRWENIGERVADVLNEALTEQVLAVSTDAVTA